MTTDDALHVLEIYKMGVETRNATFETEIPSWKEWNLKHHVHCRFVYTENNIVLGWVALLPVSTRKAYQGVAELSIYIDTYEHGKGIGSFLMEKLIQSSEEKGIWTLYSSIFPENKATMKLHQKFGFRIIGTRERIAQLDGKWRDTVLLERRSNIVGL